MKNFHGLLLVGCCALALAGCGPSDIAAPGTGGDINVNNPPAPTPSPTPTLGSGGVVAAAACPSIVATGGLKDDGVISGPTGSYRVCTLPRFIDKSSALTKVPGLVYQINGRVDVGCDGGFQAPTATSTVTSSTVGCPTATLAADTKVELTIQPGVIVIATRGASWLAVNRGNTINAVGTATQPIIFTAADNVTQPATFNETSQGLWGGVVLMGRAPVTDCTTGTIATQCERQTEGAADPARFGGAEAGYSAGRMSFVQIRYSGFILGANVELQSLTGEGVGTGTTIDHIMSYNSSDDGSEWFGGSPSMKYYISVGADDDSLDVDTGAQMNVQHALLLQRNGKGDALMEIDSDGNETDTPRTKLQVANFTAIQREASSNNEAADRASTLFRGNSDTTLVNGIIYTPNNECIRMNGSGAAPATLRARSVAMTCSAAAKYINTGTGVDAAASFGTGANNNSDAFTSTLTGLFIDGANETGVATTDPNSLFAPVSTFFDTPAYIGAVKTGGDTWYTGWTCNSDVADFGAGNSGSCTSLPTT